jgi:serine/threonine protein kinase
MCVAVRVVGFWQLADFGVSKNIVDQTNTFAGTPLTMAPEVLRREPYTVVSDIWSLGAVIYELYTKTPLFTANTMVSLLRQVRHTSSRRMGILPPTRMDSALVFVPLLCCVDV